MEEIRITQNNNNNNNSSSSDNNITKRLMLKVTEQAKELSNLSSELRETKKILENYENNNNYNNNNNNNQEMNYLTSSSKLSKDAQKKRLEKEHKDQIHALERQLSIIQHRLEETSKQKNQLIIENEKLIREAKFHEKCAIDSQHDVQRLRVQLETLNRKLGIDNNNSGNNNNGVGKTMNLFEEMKLMKNEYKSCELERNQLRDENNELVLKVKVLEDALEFRANEIGLAGHADLLTKISYLKGEISALKKDLTSKSRTVESLQQEKTMIQTGHDSLKHQVDELQHRLTETKHDLHRSRQLLDIPLETFERVTSQNQSKNQNQNQNQSKNENNNNTNNIIESTSPHVVVNALDQIKSLEQERDLLIEFIQSDMQKSSDLLTELSEIKIQNKNFIEENDKLNRQKSLMEEKLEKYEKKYQKLHEEYIQIERVFRDTERERNEFKVLSEKRIEEIEELYESQSKSTNQLSDYQKTLDKLERENRQLKAENHEKTMNLTIQTKDAEMWKGRYQDLESQFYNVSNELQEFKPKTRGLESEYKRLYTEHEKLLKEREELIENLTGFREYHEVKSEIDNELESIISTIKQKDFSNEQEENNLLDSTSSITLKGLQSRTTPKKMNKKLSQQSNVNKLIVRNVVEKHGLWCGLHAIKTFHPLMSEFIRILYQDLHDTYQNYKKIEEENEKIEQLNQEYINKLKHYEQDNLEYHVKSHQFDNIEKKIEEKEREWNRFTEEIRYVIISAVQMMENDNKNKFRWKQSDLTEIQSIKKDNNNNNNKINNQNQSKGKSKSKYQTQDNNSNEIEPYELYEPIENEGSEEIGNNYNEYKTHRDLSKLRDDEIRLDDLIADIQQPENHQRSYLNNDLSSLQHQLVDSIHQFSLKTLPSFLSQLLIHNITIANNYQQLHQSYTELQQSNLILQQKNSTTYAINSNLQETIKHSKQQVEQLNQSYHYTEEELKNQTIEATELAEKQNALIMTLEAKLTDMRRKLLLKGSQITSLQQREVTMQKKLYGTLKNVYEQISIHFTNNLSINLSNNNLNTFSTTLSPDSIPTLPELLNITHSCFDDIIRWQNNLNIPINKINSKRIERSDSLQNNNKNNNNNNNINSNKNDHLIDDDYGDEVNRDDNNSNINNTINRRSFRGGDIGGSIGSYEEWLRKRPPSIPKR